MKLLFLPKTPLEKFGIKVLNSLVDNFPQSFFVGGMPRDLIINKKITDIDIATEAKPEEVIGILKKAGIKFSETHKNFGIIVAEHQPLRIEIVTFRKEVYANSRYPKITFTKSLKQDAKRRDFTINSLYFKLNSEVLDPWGGIMDIKRKKIRFIGDIQTKIKEDPIRIIRAIRFAIALNFKLDKQSLDTIKNNLHLLETITQSRIKNELAKVKNKIARQKIISAIKK